MRGENMKLKLTLYVCLFLSFFLCLLASLIVYLFA